MGRNKAYYHPCPNCGCNLDPGERCDCEREFPTISGVSDTLLIGYDLSKGTDLACLTVGRKASQHGMYITKIFYGEKAIKMYAALTEIDPNIQYNSCSDAIPDL